MTSSFEYNYPNTANLQFKVGKTEGGYRFTFFNEDGSENVNLGFSINEAMVNNTIAATGYTAKQGYGIELYRDYLQRNHPSIIK